MDKRGRTIVERNAVMDEMSNYFQELAKANATAIEEKKYMMKETKKQKTRYT